MKVLARPSRLALLALALVPGRLLFAEVAPPPAAGAAAAPAPAAAPGTAAPAAPRTELKLLRQFDKDGDHLLNAAERQAAREHLAANPPPQPANRTPPTAREPAKPGITLTPADVKKYGREPLYDPNVLRTFFFTFDDPNWEKTMETFRRTDVDLAASLEVDGQTYRDISVHFRGATSYSRVATGYKRSMSISMDAKHRDQTLLGFRDLNVLNAHTDPSFLRSVLYSRVAQEYIATPRVNFVRVVINGENWGVYPHAEQFNHDFTKDRFGTAKGARWKIPGSPAGRGSLAYLGDDPAPYRAIYSIKSKDDPKSWALLARACKVLNQTSPERLEAELSPLLDIDGALRFLAIDTVFVNGDGYWTRTSDYCIAEDKQGRLRLVPHDMNETFSLGGGGGGAGRGGAAGAGAPVAAAGTTPSSQPAANAPAANPPASAAGGGRGNATPPMEPPVPGGVKLEPLAITRERTALGAKLLAVPALRTRYLGYVRELADQWLDWKRLGPIAQQYHDLIDADVKRDTRKLDPYEDFATSLTDHARSLKVFADQRREFLLNHPEIKKLSASH